MTRPPILRLLAAVAVCIGTASPAAAQRSAGVDAFDLLFFGPEGAVVLRLYVDPGGESVSDVRREYAASVLRRLDDDGDGVLSDQEARNIPQDGQGAANSATLGEGWTALDVDPQDGMISPDELHAFIDRSLGAPFRVEVKPPSLDRSVTLHAELDADGDGKVSRSEIENGLAALRQFDFDDDETLSVGELQPFPTTILQGQRREQANRPNESPVASLVTEEQRDIVRRRLVQLYGEDGMVPCERLGLREADAAAYDQDGDGRLNGDELRAFLEAPLPSVALDCVLNRRIVAVSRRVRPGPLVEFGDIRGNSPELSLAGVDVTTQASNSVAGRISDAQVTISFYMVKFIEFDADKNRYLDPAEFASLNLPRADFQTVDADGDGMLTRDELKAHLELYASLMQATIVVTIANEGTTLFKILETSLDYRLSPREFREGAALIAQYDQNGDGQLARSELQDRYNLEISLEKPEFLQNLFANADTMQNQQRIEGIRRPQTAGPTWFRRMDRNQDGDLTWREFFGTREDFARLDADGDGLIDLDEAVAAE